MGTSREKQTNRTGIVLVCDTSEFVLIGSLCASVNAKQFSKSTRTNIIVSPVGQIFGHKLVCVLCLFALQLLHIQLLHTLYLFVLYCIHIQWFALVRHHIAFGIPGLRGPHVRQALKRRRRKLRSTSPFERWRRAPWTGSNGISRAGQRIVFFQAAAVNQPIALTLMRLGPGGTSAPLGQDRAVVVKTVLGSHFGVGEFTTHFRTYFSGDWDVHWGYGILTYGHMAENCCFLRMERFAFLLEGPETLSTLGELCQRWERRYQVWNVS